MIDSLAAIVASVDHGAISAGQAFGAGDLSRSPVQVAEKLFVLLLRMGNGRNMLARHHENVHRRLRLDIREGVAVVILINRFRWNAPIDDLAEKAAHGCWKSTG